MGGGTAKLTYVDLPGGISIHPPRGGWDPIARGIFGTPTKISIHPPRGGWDALKAMLDGKVGISIHPPRGGWD